MYKGRYCLLVAIVLAAAILEYSAAYQKAIGPYKYYRARPRSRSRWPRGPPGPPMSTSAGSAASWRYHRANKSPHCDSSRHRYAPLYEDLSSHEQPYTIVIQLPKADPWHKRAIYRRGSVAGEEDAGPDAAADGQGDGEGDGEGGVEEEGLEEERGIYARTLRLGQKRVRIKVLEGVRPKVHIKISRSDTVRGSSIATANLSEDVHSEWTPVTPAA